MRCLKCGYDNEPNAQVCIKCGRPYNVSNPVMPQQPYMNQPVNMPQQPVNMPQQPVGNPQPRPTMLDAGYQQGMQQHQPQSQPQPRPTVLDSRAAMNAMNNNMNNAAVAQTCPACGYPVQGRSMCPACGYPIAQQPQQPQPMPQPAVQQPYVAQPQPVAPVVDMNMTVVCEKCGNEVSIANKFCPCCGERIHLATQPIIRRKPQPKCSLTLVPEEGESIAASQQTYEGTSIILNRDNTEPGNRTITSREQAELTCEDGKWYIENKSDYGTTYIMAKRKIELQPGDVIVLGDRTFEFNRPE